MDDFQILRENILFHDLTDSDFEKLFKISSQIEVMEGDYFLHEGDVAEEFYYILSGQVAITKLEQESQHEFVVAHIESGNAVGEIALLDHKPRSASAKAETPLKLLRIPFNQLRKLAEKSPGLSKIILRIVENVGGRLRLSNTATVTALEQQLQEYKKRTAIGLFMTNVVFCLSLFTVSLSWIIKEMSSSVSSTTITFPLTVLFFGLFLSIMKSSKLPLSAFGLTTKNWRKAVFESILFTIILCIGLVLYKWVLISTSIFYVGHHIFEPYLAIQHTSTTFSQNQIWWMIFAIYWIVVAPLQELIVRGGLQGPLEVFLTEKYVSLKAIVISNVLFGTVHVFMGLDISLLVFLAGLYFGWLYSRHHTLIGVILAHGILGTWGLMVVGL